jgi:coenzyme PQQ precursor peptide PqqA
MSRLVYFSCIYSARKGVSVVEWVTPDFEEYELSCEVTAYAAHW